MPCQGPPSSVEVRSTTTRLSFFSPSQLNAFLECEHLTQLTQNIARTGGREERARDAHADLLAKKGAEHELAWLHRLQAEGRVVTSVQCLNGERDWVKAAEQTLAAMRAGDDVIYQAVFLNDRWRGIADFLGRVDEPSALGSWSYEVWDTKLARQGKPYFALQLSFYTEQLARLQGREPESMHVVLGTQEQLSLRSADFAAYYRRSSGVFCARSLKRAPRTHIQFRTVPCATSRGTVSNGGKPRTRSAWSRAFGVSRLFGSTRLASTRSQISRRRDPT
jgi:predicted RecB family nuclease